MEKRHELNSTQAGDEKFAEQNERLISSGNAQLDYVLGGGLSPNCFFLVEGDPGAGKTTLALGFELEGVRQNEPTLYIALTEGQEELATVARSHDLKLDGIDIVDLSPGSEMLNKVGATMYHPSEIELGELTKSITDAFEKYKPLRVVIDSLSELRHLSQSELRYRRQLVTLKSFFCTKSCTVLLINDRRETVDLQLQGVARGSIEMQRTTPNYGRIRRRLQVSKMRGQKVRSGFHDFTIEQGGIQVYPRLVAAEHASNFESSCISSGIEKLDSLLGGGIQRGTSTLATFNLRVGNRSWTRQSIVFLQRTEVWRLQLPKI